jgi:hypothetical protein
MSNITGNRVALAATTVLLSAGLANADVIFGDDFESGLGNWIGKNGGAHQGMIVADPLGGSNNVLTFSGLNAGGDMFTVDSLELDASDTYRLSFDYLGLEGPHTLTGDTGGYVGFSVSTPGTHSWQWATGTVSGASDVLIDDGQWRSYAFDFTRDDLGIGSSVRLMLEDFSGSGGVAGDAFFDNITIATVPAPASAFALAGLALIGGRKRR